MIAKSLHVSVTAVVVFLSSWLGATHNPDTKVVSTHAFEEPLIAIGGKEQTGEDTALVSALQTYQKRKSYEDVSAITTFLSDHPQSPWKFSLLANLGIVYRKTGHFSRALDAWEQAWALGKGEKDVKIQALANRVASELASLLSSLGRTDRLSSLLTETNGRTFYGSVGTNLSSSKENLWWMKNRPGESFKCGPFALDSIRTFVGRKMGPHPLVLKAQSGTKGFSLTQVRDLSVKMKMNFQMAKRGSGADFVIPSVAHWKSGHYAALLKKEGDLYLTKDPTFGQELLVTAQALEDESSGYYLVPSGPLPAGWNAVLEAEGNTVWGRGLVSTRTPGATKPDDNKCGCSGNGSNGMAVYSIFAMLASLSIDDTPVGYTPPIGPDVHFVITYNELEANQYASSTAFNFGPAWNCTWLSYVTMPISTGAPVTINTRGGGQESYTNYNATTAYPGYVGYYSFEPQSQASVWVTTSGTYERRLPDGSKEVFSQPSSASSPVFMYLQAIIDPQGNSVTLGYDTTSSYYVSTGNTRLTTVTDAQGLSTTLTYGLSADLLKVTQITDPFNRSAIFNYTSYSGTYQLTSITDVVGIVSHFNYGAGSNITSMVTPYGTTTFTALQSGTTQTINATEPDGSEVYAESRIDGNNYPYPASSEPYPAVPVSYYGSLVDSYLNERNTYYWDKKAMAVTGNNPTSDYTKAHIYHFLHEPSGGPVEYPILESEKPALENRIWYFYPGQGSSTQIAGISAQPTIVARVIGSGSGSSSNVECWQYQYANETSPGSNPPLVTTGLTAVIDPMGRQTNYTCDATNGIDLTTITQNNSSAGKDTLFSATYNGLHEPLTIIDAANKTTTYTYNSVGQITSFTPPIRAGQTAESTTFGYTNNYLTTITGPISGAVTTRTYDTLNGHTVNRVKTLADAENYTLTYDYDNLDRATEIQYPDSTTQTFSYLNPTTSAVDLDLHVSIDRLGRTTSRTYDSTRHMTSITDPLNRTVHYGWCSCGNIISLTDPMGNITQYNRDLESRLTAKVYANSSQVSYTYDTVGRLGNRTDARGNVTTYAYNPDDTLSGTSYALAAGTAATANESYGYDVYYPRLTSAGGVTLGYVASGSLGADQVSSVTNTLTGGTASIAYTYDEWGRKVGSNIASANPQTVTLDSLGRVTNVTNLLAPTLPGFAYSYYDPSHPTNRTGGITYPNGQSTSFTYFNSYNNFSATGDENLKEINNLAPSSAVLSQNNYTVDALDKTLTWKQQTDSNTPTLWTDGYDLADQLTSAVKTNTSNGATLATTNDTYDVVGNRTQELTSTGVQMATTFNNLNQITRTGTGSSAVFAGSVNKPVNLTVNGEATTLTGTNTFSVPLFLPGGTNTVPLVATDAQGNKTANFYQLSVPGSSTSPTYDTDGNELTDENGNAYQWDAENRLVQITKGSSTYVFGYDAFNRRITETDNGTLSKQWVWDGLQMAEERNAGNTVTKRFYWLGEQISGTNYYYTRDHLGSVREMLNSSGTIIARYDYDPYGRVALVSGTNLGDFQYGGYYTHQPSGLNLTLYRAYDPNTARWLSRDPIAERGGINVYGYVGDEPIDRIDSLGLDYFFLNHSGAAWFQGHTGSLVGNPQDGYDYYSKDGYPPAQNVHQHFNSLDDFNRDPLSKQYDRRVDVPTSRAQDKAMKDYANTHYNSPYSFPKNNCGDLSNGVMNAGGIHTPNASKVAGITRPNTQYDSLAPPPPSPDPGKMVMQSY